MRARPARRAGRHLRTQRRRQELPDRVDPVGVVRLLPRSVDEVRTTGVNDECIVEVTFEHEGHTYSCAARITGGGKTTQTRRGCHCATGLQVASGRPRSRAYVQQVHRHEREGLPGLGLRRAEAARGAVVADAGRAAQAGAGPARHHADRVGRQSRAVRRTRQEGCSTSCRAWPSISASSRPSATTRPPPSWPPAPKPPRPRRSFGRPAGGRVGPPSARGHQEGDRRGPPGCQRASTNSRRG